jgi:hypothetical protein
MNISRVDIVCDDDVDDNDDADDDDNAYDLNGISSSR